MPSLNPALPVAVATLAFLGFTAIARAGAEADQVIKDSMPAYDPKAQTEPLKPRPIKRLSDPYARLPEVKLVPGAPPPASAGTSDNKGVLVLPKMTVKGAKDKVPSLPRIFVQPPVKNVPEPYMPAYETPEARAARLVRKHIPPIQQALNGKRTVEAEAVAAEARERVGNQLNSIADILELSAQLGLDDPKEQKKLRAEYQNALLDRPR